VVVLFVLIQDFKSVYCFLKDGRACLGFFGCVFYYLVQITKVNEGNHGTGEVRVKCFRLPEAKTNPVKMVLFGLICCIEDEAIRAGMFKGLAAVHSFAQDEKGERATLLIRAVSGDFLHDKRFWRFVPIFPLPPLPQFFQEKIEKGKKEKKETISQ
jgi:hypothetical protein